VRSIALYILSVALVRSFYAGRVLPATVLFDARTFLGYPKRIHAIACWTP
jgi:hypothetical protein